MTFKEGVKEASPVNLHSIGKKTHVTVEMGTLIRGVIIVAMAVAAYLNFIARIDSLEGANLGLQKQMVVADSLLRKDLKLTLNSLHKDISTNTAEAVTALGTSIKEVKTSLETEEAALNAAITANSEKIGMELDNLKELIVAANSTTYAELKPVIDNIENALDIQAKALNQRIALIEGQLQDQVKRSFFERFGKK